LSAEQSTALTVVARGLANWIRFVERFALMIAVVVFVLTAGIYVYTADNLTINTSTTDMLSEELPFRQRYIDYQAAFPQFSNLITIVVDAKTPDRADVAALALAARLRRTPAVIEKVYDLAGHPFFRGNGLLYHDLERLEDLSDRLASAQGLLGALTADPSLRGFFDVLSLAIDDLLAGNDPAGDVGLVFERMAETVAARVEGGTAELSWQLLLSGKTPAADDLRRFIQVRPAVDWSSLAPAKSAMRAIREIARDLQLDASQGVRVRLTGAAALSTEELSSVFEGAKTASVLSFVLVAGLLLFGLRSFRLVAATLLTLLAGLIWTAGFATLAVGHLNLLSVAFAVLFIGLGVDFAIHFALRYAEAIGEGAAPAMSLEKAAVGVGLALILCAVSAAIGFYSFLPTAYLGLAELGLISGSSMFIALFMSLTLLPALLALAPLRKVRRRPVGVGDMEAFLHRSGGRLTILFLTLAGGAILLSPGARFDFDPLHLQDPSTESVQTALDLIRDGKRSPKRIVVLAPDPRAADGLATRLKELPAVSKALSLNDFVPKAQDEKLALIEDMALVMMPVFDDAARLAKPLREDITTSLGGIRAKLAKLSGAKTVSTEIRRAAAKLENSLAGIPDDVDGTVLKSLSAGLLGLFDNRMEQLRSALEAGPVSQDDIPAVVRDRYLAADGRARIAVSPAFSVETNDALRRFIDEVRTIAPEATGSPIVIFEASRAVVEAIAQAAITAAVLIAFLLIWLLRNPRDVLLVFYPLALAGLLTVGTAVLLGLPFNFANVIVLPLLMGLGVASGIHLVMRTRASDDGTALLSTSTPRAVIFSALTTICSFGSLAVSNHRGTASMGELLTISIGYTLVCSLIALPALMGWLEIRGYRR